jgi:cell shape-determining protein MreC
VADLLSENADLRKKLEKKNYDQVYRENQLMNLELKNMYIIMEENKDLKDDLNRLKNISYDCKIKEITQENQDIRKRNGYLLI